MGREKTPFKATGPLEKVVKERDEPGFSKGGEGEKKEA